ncbi:MAG: sigma-70 family RNA polymerase sigma factor [Chitinophagaceae bacterium]|nr:MAG: sigma-70 family RNA polymerase sigma factor [Chitinophagaceae bacterium]
MAVATGILPVNVQSIPEMDERGFAGFFREQFPLLTHYARRLSGQEQEAEEIASDAFFKVWERRDNYRHPLVMKAFVYTAVRYACLNLRRDKRRETARFRRFSHTLPTQEGNVLQSISNAESCREALTAVGTLPQRCRLVFESLFFNGQSPTEVAISLRLSVSTVRNQKARAFLLLRRKMSDTGNFPVDPDYNFPEL